MFSVGEFVGPMLAGSIVSKFGFQTVSTIIAAYTFFTVSIDKSLGHRVANGDYLILSNTFESLNAQFLPAINFIRLT